MLKSSSCAVCTSDLCDSHGCIATPPVPTTTEQAREVQRFNVGDRVHVFRNNVTEWVVAYDIKDAGRVLTEFWKKADPGVDPSELDFEFQQVDDSESLVMNDYGGSVTKTAREWANEKGCGFLMSTEY